MQRAALATVVLVGFVPNLRYVVNWQHCRASCRQVATGHAYRPSARDRGARLRIEVVAHNALGAATALSARTGVVR